MASIIQILPAETIDQIIDVVADNDEEDEMQYPFEMRDVKACSLTCKTFAMRCRRRIYHSVRLFDTPHRYHSSHVSTNPSLAHSFGKLIANKPEIADHVRELEYNITLITLDNPLSLPPSLEGLKKLRKLSLCSEECRITWPKLVQSASWPLLLRLMACPTVTQVELRSVDGLNISDLGTCQHLKTLILHHCDLSEGNATVLPPSPPSGPLKLQQLSIFAFTRILQTLLTRRYADNTPIIDSSELRQVTIDMLPDSSDSAIQDYIDFVYLTPNLDVLGLLNIPIQTNSRSQASVYVPRLLNFSSLKSLNTLTLGLLDNSRWIPGSGTLDIPKVLNSISTQNSIERLTLNIDVFVSEPPPQNRWETIKQCVAQFEWPHLIRVDLSMCTTVVKSWSVDGSATFIRVTPVKCLVEVPSDEADDDSE